MIVLWVILGIIGFFFLLFIICLIGIKKYGWHDKVKKKVQEDMKKSSLKVKMRSTRLSRNGQYNVESSKKRRYLGGF